jgi:hypothetical protein
MQDAVEPRRLWRISGLHRDFEGVLSMTGFKICRVINYRNSFLPIVVGKMLPRLQGGTRIEVQMRMQWIVTAFMLLWPGFPVLLLTTALLHIDIGILDSRAPQGLRPTSLPPQSQWWCSAMFCARSHSTSKRSVRRYCC